MEELNSNIQVITKEEIKEAFRYLINGKAARMIQLFFFFEEQGKFYDDLARYIPMLLGVYVGFSPTKRTFVSSTGLLPLKRYRLISVEGPLGLLSFPLG